MRVAVVRVADTYRRHTYCRLHGEQASRRSKKTYDSERERRRRRGTSEPARVRLDASDEARGYRSARRGGRRRLLEVRPTHTTGRTVGPRTRRRRPFAVSRARASLLQQGGRRSPTGDSSREW